MEYTGALDSARWQECQRQTVTLTKSSADYYTYLTPILRYARSLVLIDPYLNPEKSRFFKTIEICSGLLGLRIGNDKLAGRIDLHSDANRQNSNFSLANWKRKLQPLADKDKHRFRIFLWESKPDSESMHDRYILTDQCGLSIPGGLDCIESSRANSTDWSFIDDDVRINRLAYYKCSTSPFNLKETTEICPKSS